MAFMLSSPVAPMPRMKPGVNRRLISENYNIKERFAINKSIGIDSSVKRFEYIKFTDYETKLKEEILLEIFASQKPAGGFEISGMLAGMLKIDISDFKGCCKCYEYKGYG